MASRPYDIVFNIEKGSGAFTVDGASASEANSGGDSGRVMVVEGKIPEDGVGFNLTSQWGTPFAEITGGTIGSVLSAFGVSLRFRIATLHVWQGSSPIALTIPMEFNANTDATEEVLKPIVRMLMLASPRIAPGGRFVPPGPTLANIAQFLKRLLNEIPGEEGGMVDRGRDYVASALETNISGGENVSVFIGDFFYLDNVVITSVQPQFYPIMDVNGIPMRATCLVSFESYLTPSNEEIKRYFNNRVELPK